MLANSDIRSTAKTKGVRLWEIAEFLKVSDPTMTRMLRRELPNKEKQRFLSIIEEIASKRGQTEVSIPTFYSPTDILTYFVGFIKVFFIFLYFNTHFTILLNQIT